VPNGWRGTISTLALNFIVNLRCLFAGIFLQKKLNLIFEVKFVIFSKKLLYRVTDEKPLTLYLSYSLSDLNK
jgi:hypothetical protein